jgi:hypothetical protein
MEKMATNYEDILKDLNMRDMTCSPVDEKQIASTLIDLGKSHFNNSDYLLARLSFEEALRILKKYFDVDKFDLITGDKASIVKTLREVFTKEELLQKFRHICEDPDGQDHHFGYLGHRYH